MQIDRPISIGIILFIVIALAFFFVVPEYKNLKNFQAELGQKRAEYAAQFEYYAQIRENYTNIQSHKEDLQKIDDALPQGSGFGQLIYYFQKKAAENGLILKNFALSQAAANKSIKETSFTLNLSGDYFSLENFITSLEKSAKIFEISSISFGSSGAVPAQQTVQVGGQTVPVVAQFQTPGVFSFNLQIKTYSY